jgi:hypothetical protein
MVKSDSVGEMRRSAAYVDCDTPIVLTSNDPELAKILARVRVVRTYPNRNHFEIEVEPTDK